MKISADTFCKRSLIGLLLALIVFTGSTSGLDYPQLKQDAKGAKEEGSVKIPTTPRLLDKAINDSLYIVGPGDVFLIQLYGMVEQPLLVEVLPEGVVSIPQVGVVRLGQITLVDA